MGSRRVERTDVLRVAGMAATADGKGEYSPRAAGIRPGGGTRPGRNQSTGRRGGSAPPALGAGDARCKSVLPDQAATRRGGHWLAGGGAPVTTARTVEEVIPSSGPPRSPPGPGREHGTGRCSTALKPARGPTPIPGSTPGCSTRAALVDQARHRILNPEMAGSSPARGTATPYDVASHILRSLAARRACPLQGASPLGRGVDSPASGGTSRPGAWGRKAVDQDETSTGTVPGPRFDSGLLHGGRAAELPARPLMGDGSRAGGCRPRPAQHGTGARDAREEPPHLPPAPQGRSRRTREPTRPRRPCTEGPQDPRPTRPDAHQRVAGRPRGGPRIGM